MVAYRPENQRITIPHDEGKRKFQRPPPEHPELLALAGTMRNW
jgi:hypothetical protein